VITGSTLSGNAATDYGGAIFAAGNNDFRLIRSTVTGNTGGFGGGFLVLASKVEVIQSTVVGNGVPGGSGDISSNGGSILAAGSILGSCEGAPITSLGYNSTLDTSCATQPTDLPATNTLLGNLQDNGGATLTRMPDLASPAINRIPVDGVVDLGRVLTALSLTTGGSGRGTVAYTVANGTSSGCTVSTTSPYKLTSARPGTCIVTATKAADVNYKAVTSAPTTITLAKAIQACCASHRPPSRQRRSATRRTWPRRPRPRP
jgi:hypothetical protein